MRRLVVNGSFVYSQAAPNDIDLIVVVNSDHDFTRQETTMTWDWIAQSLANGRQREYLNNL